MFGRYVEKRLPDVEHLVVVDVHTGLGSFGDDTLLVNADEGDPKVSRVRDASGDWVASRDPGRGPAYRVTGSFDTLYSRALPNADVDAVVQEFGTYNVVRVLQVLRAENRWQHYGDGTVDHPTKLALKECFAPKSPSWRKTVLERGATVIDQAIRLLEAGRPGASDPGGARTGAGQN